jgi:8-oxo-dGTP diphosphatase
MAHFALQFGKTEHQVRYTERFNVHGICSGNGGKLALVRIGKAHPFRYDLPGGGIETGESDADALIREFEEETGLTVWPIRALGRAGQFWNNEGAPLNSLASFFEVEMTASDSRPTEPDHELVWVTPEEALRKVRHDSHAWAILSWMREQWRNAGR